MTVHQGNIHNYIQMTLDYTEGGTVKVSIIDYINEITAEFNKADQRGHGINTIAAPEDLYKVDEDYDKLSTDKANMFHNLAEKTLYTTNQARPYTCELVAFITTIIRETNKDD